MAFLLNLLLRPSAKNERVITASFSKTGQFTTPRQYVVEFELERANNPYNKKYDELLKDSKIQKLNSIDILSFFNTACFIPDGEPCSIIDKIENCKISVSPATQEDFSETITWNDANFLDDKICKKEFVTIKISEQGNNSEVSGNVEIRKEKDAKKVRYNLTDDTKKELGNKDINIFIRLEFLNDQGAYIDYIIITITPQHRVWYGALDFGSEASQYKMQNSFYKSDQYRYPSEKAEVKYLNLVLGLNRLTNEKNHNIAKSALENEDPFSKLNFLQKKWEDDFNLYSSIFFADKNFSGEEQFVLNKKINGKPAIYFLYEDNKEAPEESYQLPNLKIAYELSNIHRQVENIDDSYTPSDIKKFRDLLNNTAFALNFKRETDNQPDLEVIADRMGQYYNAILNTILLAIITQIHEKHLISTQSPSKIKIENNPTNNFIFKILLPNMLTTSQVNALLDGIQKNIWDYKQATLDAIESFKDGELKNEIVESLLALNTIELIFVSESDAAIMEVAGQLNKQKEKYDYIFCIDIGKGTTDISILKNDYQNDKLYTEFRTGFPGAGNYITYFYAMAFICDLIASYNLLEELETEKFESIQNRMHKELSKENNNNTLGRYVNPDVLKPLLSGNSKLPKYFSQVIEAIKKGYNSQISRDNNIHISKFIEKFDMGGLYNTVSKEIEYGSLNFDEINIDQFQEWYKDKRVKFETSNVCDKIIKTGYREITSHIDTLLHAAFQSGKYNLNCCLVLTGRGSLDKELSKEVKKVIQNLFPNIKPIELEDLFPNANPTALRKNCAVFGGVSKTILNMGANVTGRLWGIKNQGLFKKNTKYLPLEDSYDPSKRGYYFSEISIKGNETTLENFSINGYKLNLPDDILSSGDKKLFFTNRDMCICYKNSDGKWESFPLNQDLSKPVFFNDEDSKRTLEKVTKFTTRSLFPFVLPSDFLKDIQEYLKQVKQ